MKGSNLIKLRLDVVKTLGDCLPNDVILNLPVSAANFLSN